MTKRIRSGFAIAAVLVLLLTGCGNDGALSSGSAASAVSGEGAASSVPKYGTAITSENAEEVAADLRAAGLSNVDVFVSWVKEYEKDEAVATAAEDTDEGADEATGSAMQDADCRMTAMLLVGDSMSYDNVNPTYNGDYLMFDLDAIDNDEQFALLRDKRALFTTLFGEVPFGGGGFSEALPSNWQTHGFQVNSEACSLVSIVFKTYDRDEAFVGHAGVLVDCRKNGKDYLLFVEKIAFGAPFVVTKISDEEELLQVFSARPDYTVDEGEPVPIVYINDARLGELRLESAADSSKSVPASGAKANDETLTLTIDGEAVPVSWEDNESVAALAALADEQAAGGKSLTIQMSPYGGFEQVGPIGESIARNDVQMTTAAGDIVLYKGDQIVLFYGSNSWSYTKLGHMELPAETLAELLGGEPVTVELR